MTDEQYQRALEILEEVNKRDPAENAKCLTDPKEYEDPECFTQLASLYPEGEVA